MKKSSGGGRPLGNSPYLESLCKICVANPTARWAFTLAEVLITLGIIGVVASLTIPQVVSGYRKNVTQNKLKQTYAILQNALLKEDETIPFSVYYATSYNPDDDCVVSTGEGLLSCAVVLFDNFFKGRIANIREQSQEYPAWYISTIDNVTASQAKGVLIHGKWFVLPNGCSVGIYNGSLSVITDELKSTRKIKIVTGKNYFQFLNGGIDTYDKLADIAPGMLPIRKSERAKYTREQLINSCKTGQNLSYLISANMACTQLFIEDGLRFADDYPIKF